MSIINPSNAFLYFSIMYRKKKMKYTRSVTYYQVFPIYKYIYTNKLYNRMLCTLFLSIQQNHFRYETII